MTAVGLFTYWGIPVAAFQQGMNQYRTADGRAFLMAGPEKALCDKIQQERGTTGSNPKELAHYLIDQLRVDESALLGLDPIRIEEIAAAYRSRKLLALAEWVRDTRSESHE